MSATVRHGRPMSADTAGAWLLHLSCQHCGRLADPLDGVETAGEFFCGTCFVLAELDLLPPVRRAGPPVLLLAVGASVALWFLVMGAAFAVVSR